MCLPPTSLIFGLPSMQVAPVPIQQCILTSAACGQDGPAAAAEVSGMWDIGTHADIVLADLFDHRYNQGLARLRAGVWSMCVGLPCGMDMGRTVCRTNGRGAFSQPVSALNRPSQTLYHHTHMQSLGGRSPPSHWACYAAPCYCLGHAAAVTTRPSWAADAGEDG